MSASVFLVTAGEYEEFYVEGVFATREVAERVASQCGDGSLAHVEEWAVRNTHEPAAWFEAVARDGGATSVQPWPTHNPVEDAFGEAWWTAWGRAATPERAEELARERLRLNEQEADQHPIRVARRARGEE